MTLAHRNFPITFPPQFALPAWAARLVGGAGNAPEKFADDSTLEFTQSDDFGLIQARVANADHLSPEEFQRRTTETYLAIQNKLSESLVPHPIRFWNYLPGIHAPTSRTTDRYMTFNAGRFAAFERWFGDIEQMLQRVPSASAVGHSGSELVIHALSSARPGRPVANPRQIAPCRYSPRFGPRPPCFARAMVIGNSTPMILVGGTASIRGEESVHLHDLHRQADETFENLATLIAHACAPGRADARADRSSSLKRFHCLRVYYPRPSDLPIIQSLVADALTNLMDAEFVQADLCRAELLIEIEGLAEA